MTGNAAERRLAIIVALDVAGYSARAEQDQDAATAEVAALRDAVDAVAAAASGRVFNTAGDGFMLEFASAQAAAEAAKQLAQSCEPAVRVGVHMGDVLVQPNGDLLGHGVNVAARLMARAQPGTALVSGDVKRMIRGALAGELRPLGVMRLDKMGEPIEAFALGAEGEAAARPSLAAPAWLAPALGFYRRFPRVIAGAALAVVALGVVALWPQGRSAGAPPMRSVAVLPFVNMSADAEQDYFSDGISEEILNVLAKIEGLRVAGRTSSFSFKGKNEDLRAIGRALNVAYVLEGSVRKQDERVRITAQLIKAEDGFHLWSETYDRDLADIFAVQDEIARAVARNLQVVLLDDAAKSLAPVATSNTRAYELFVESQAHPWTEDPRGVELVEQALALDPEFARAHASLAWRLAVRSQHGDTDAKRDVELAESHARRALALDPTQSTAHAALGFLYFFERRFSDMEAQFLRGVAVDGDDPRLLWLYGTTMNATGRLSEARRIMRRVQDIDPLWTTPYAYNAQIDWSLGEHGELRRLADFVAAAGDGDANFMRAAIAQVDGDAAAMANFYARAYAPYDVGYSEPEVAAIYRAAVGSAGERARARAIVETGVARLPGGRHMMAPTFLLLLGDRERALALFEREFDPKDENFFTTIWQPFPEIVAFRRSAQFKSFARRIGLLDYWRDYGWPDLCRPLGDGGEDFACR